MIEGMCTTSLLEKDPSLAKAVGEAVADGATDRDICMALGICPSTLQRWKKLGKIGAKSHFRDFWLSYQQGLIAFTMRSKENENDRIRRM
jgi:hypothetical protein